MPKDLPREDLAKEDPSKEDLPEEDLPKVVALNDLLRQTQSLRAELASSLDRVLASGWYILGRECATFEEEFAAYCGVPHCVSVANGTDALELGLRSLGIGPGDTVATVANAGGYSTTAIRAAGAEPLYIDIDLATMNMSATDLAARLTNRSETSLAPFRSDVRAVIATHLYGRMADLPALLAVTEHHGVPLIEDCAQAHGASLAGRKAGSWGALACFSFYPTKNLGALGDGGAITTADAQLAGRVKSLRQYGWSSKYRSAEYGRNSRMDEMQAAILRAKLPHLDGWNVRRRQIAATYNRVLAGQPFVCPPGTGEDYVAHLYVLRTTARAEVRAALKNRGIATDIHYPVPDHLQEAARATQSKVRLPATEQAAREVLTLPCYAELEAGEVAAVAAALEALAQGANVG